MAKKTGRPSAFTPEVADAICERIACGESLKSICGDNGMPALSSVFKWLSEKKEFSDRYVRAREAQADALFDEILHISNTPVTGVKTITKATGVETTEGDMIDHRRLQIDARKWIAARLAPKKYGDKTTISGDPENPLQVEDVTDAKRKAAVALLLAKSQ